MKTIITCFLFSITALAASAQAINIAQDFNSSCDLSTGFPPDWSSYNPVPSTIPEGAWTCAPSNGRSGTSGIKCTSVWGTPAAYHLDTAYLISPALNLSGYSGSIYLHFDSKVSNINLGARMSLILSSDSTHFDTSGGAFFADRSDFLTPVFSNDDSTDWVTHVADLTPFKTSTPLYVAFRYTSTSTTGSTWYIDNVFTTTFPAHVQGPDKDMLGLTVIGNSTRSSITLSCKTATTGKYHLNIYNMLGAIVYNEDMILYDSKATYGITGLNLTPGMYLIKMSNGLAYATVKTIVQ